MSEFSPNNPVVKRCLQGLGMEENGKPDEASKLFFQAWTDAESSFEKFIAAHYVARHQKTVSDRLKWLEIVLQFALEINNDSVKSAFPNLYSNLADCYEQLNDTDNAKKYNDLALSFRYKPSDKGPFYHGTKADLQIGDLLKPGGLSNYNPEIKMNHIYFTALANGAGLAAELAQGAKKQPFVQLKLDEDSFYFQIPLRRPE